MPELPPEEWDKANNECCLAVGHFMSSFSFAEVRLDEALGAAFGLDDLQRFILAVNIPINQKINILKVAIDVAQLAPKMIRHYERHLNRLAELATERNTIAHYPFGPTDDAKGVNFIVVTAKGKLDWPETQWTFEQIRQKCKRLDQIEEKLKTLAEELERIHARKILDKHLPELATKARSGGLGLLGSLYLPSLVTPSSLLSDANQQKEPRNSFEPEE